MKVSSVTHTLNAAIAVLLAGCGGWSDAGAPAPAAPPDTWPPSGDRGGCPTSHCIAVANVGSYDNDIVFFPRGANGNVRPRGKIKGSLTQLDYPAAIAIDSAGEIYAANAYANSITVYAAGAEGNIAPIRAILGSRTGLYEPTGVVLDAKGRLYVANNRGNSVTEYSAGSNGNVRPLRSITGIKTMLRDPWGLALDTKSNIYVTTVQSINITPRERKATRLPRE